MKKVLIEAAAVFAVLVGAVLPLFGQAPSGLMTDLLERTETVWRDGLPTNLTLDALPPGGGNIQYAAVRSARPTFSWIVGAKPDEIDAVQSAYEIEVTRDPAAFSPETKESSDKKADAVRPDVWSSGRVESSASSSVPYDGKPLEPSSVYRWRVRTWNGRGEVSPWSVPKIFKTADELSDYAASRYPTVVEIDSPKERVSPSPRTLFCDFGRASFGQFLFRAALEGPVNGRFAVVRLGERLKEGKIDRNPPGSTRYAEYRVELLPGQQTYWIQTRIDKRNSSGAAVRVPDGLGEVMPFRYAEIELGGPWPEDVSPLDVISGEARRSAYYPFDESAASFHCDSEALNRVWELCRYSIKATSFLGYYIDGDRERIPYEGDALLNQLSHYGTDREFTLARNTGEYLIFHPTWPTEWILQSVQMAWYDYLYTGDIRSVEKFYDEFKAKSLIALAEENGLISTRKGKLTKEVLDAIHFDGKAIRDIADWPHQGLAGNENAESGETDGFVFCDMNAVVNAYHYFALRSMKNFAERLGRSDDAAFFTAQIEKLRKSYQEVFFDAERGVYRDGDSTDHASLHGNMFPLCFGLVPPEHRKSVTEFVRSRGMRCSVYGAQFLLDAIYEGEDGAYGLERMTSDDLRGWLNMLRVGSTITLEAWDDRYKPNQDWNHAWGAAPANMIPRKLVGVEPLLPAFERFRVKPQIADLTEVRAVVPTIRGPVSLTVNRSAEAYALTVAIPANTRADVYVPVGRDGETLTLDGRRAEEVLPGVTRCGSFWFLPEVGSGVRKIERR